MAGALTALLVLVAVVAACEGKTRWHQLGNYTFEDYEGEFARTYATPEERAARRKLVETRLDAIRAHNANPSFSWKEGVNQFTDRTEEEFRRRLGYDQEIGYRQPKSVGVSAAPAGVALPASVDWRTAGVVSAVKDQGDCGSCWTFAAASTIESQYAVKTGKLPVLSEQHILGCVPNPQECGGTGGCEGGTAELAYGTLNATGIASEWTYPYQSYHGQDFKCTFSAQTPAAVRFSGYVKLPENEHDALMQAVANLGPIAVSVEASRWSAYEEGVFDGCNQVNPDIDHAVQLVGYGFDDKLQMAYWTIRNSWSPEYGEKGYIRIRRTDSEQTRCGTDITPGDGSGCKGGPKTVEVCGTCGVLYDTCYPTF